jgi:hypothetical protein
MTQTGTPLLRAQSSADKAEDMKKKGDTKEGCLQAIGKSFVTEKPNRVEPNRHKVEDWENVCDYFQEWLHRGFAFENVRRKSEVSLKLFSI